MMDAVSSSPSAANTPNTNCLSLRFGNQVEEMDARHTQLLMGRGPKNRFSLAEEETASSRNHARIEYRADGFYLLDQSSNGTYIIHSGGSVDKVHRDEFRLLGKGIICLGREMNFDDVSAIHYQVVVVAGQHGENGNPELEKTHTRMEAGANSTDPPLLRALQESPLANGMTLDECRKLASMVTLRSLITSEPLVEEGETGSTLYCIVSGSLGVYTITENTMGNSCLHILEAGDMAGEFGFVERIERTASLRAMGPTEILCLDSQRFDPFVEANPMIGYKMMRTIVHSVRQSLIRLNLEKMDLESTLRRYLRKIKG